MYAKEINLNRFDTNWNLTRLMLDNINYLSELTAFYQTFKVQFEYIIEVLEAQIYKEKRLTIFISSQFKTGNMNHVMNLQFLIFAFNHILETSDYCTWDFVGGE